jgi:hypothetical protein
MRWNRILKITPAVALVAIIGTTLSTVLEAQGVAPNDQCDSVKESFERFEADVVRRSGSPRGTGCISAIMHRSPRVMLGDRPVQATDVDAVIEGLVERARGHESELVRLRAATSLGGTLYPDSGYDGPSLMPLVLRLYEEVDDPFVRGGLMRGLAYSGDSRALPLLSRVAVQPDDEEGYPGAARDALYGLVRVGAEGQAVLARLHRDNAVQASDARIILRRLAENDFQLPLPPRGRPQRP